jgi:hypothetical protein
MDALIRQTQARVAPLGVGTPAGGTLEPRKTGGARGGAAAHPVEEVELLRRQHNRLQRQVAKLHGTLGKRDEELRILQDLAAELQRELASRWPTTVG